MITRQLLSGGAFWTNCPRGRRTSPSSRRQSRRVPALQDLGVSHIARCQSVGQRSIRATELMGSHLRRGRGHERWRKATRLELLQRYSARSTTTRGSKSSRLAHDHVAAPRNKTTEEVRVVAVDDPLHQTTLTSYV
jgi:hypothetical protein